MAGKASRDKKPAGSVIFTGHYSYLWGIISPRTAMKYRILLTVISLSLLLPQDADAQEAHGGTEADQRYGVTEFSVNFMREKPDFPEELGNQLLMGTPVKITGREGYWLRVVSPEPYQAWCVEKGIVEMDREEARRYVSARKYIVTTEYSHVFTEADEDSERISDLVAGDLLRIAFKEGGGMASDTARKCIPARKKGFVKVLMPSGTEGYVRRRDVEEFGKWAATREATPGNIVRTAMMFLGIPYQWGGTSVKGMDCSGFTRMVWFMNGVLLPRNASQQAMSGEKIPYPGKSGVEIQEGTIRSYVAALEPGDLLFFGNGQKATHVGIYIGGGQFIHASQKVRISSLIPGEAGFYEYSSRLMWACRVIGQEDKGTGVTSMLKSPAYFPGEETGHE